MSSGRYTRRGGPRKTGAVQSLTANTDHGPDDDEHSVALSNSLQSENKIASALQAASSAARLSNLKACSREGLIPAYEARAQPYTVPRTSPERPAARRRHAAFTEAI